MDLSRLLNPLPTFQDFNGDTESAGTNSVHQLGVGLSKVLDPTTRDSMDLSRLLNPLPTFQGFNGDTESAGTNSVHQLGVGLSKVLDPTTRDSMDLSRLLNPLPTFQDFNGDTESAGTDSVHQLGGGRRYLGALSSFGDRSDTEASSRNDDTDIEGHDTESAHYSTTEGGYIGTPSSLENRRDSAACSQDVDIEMEEDDTTPTCKPRRINGDLDGSLKPELRFAAILKCQAHKTWAFIAKKYEVHFGKVITPVALCRRWTRIEPTDDSLLNALLNYLPIPEEWQAEVDWILRKYAPTEKGLGPRERIPPEELSELRFIAVLRCRGQQLTFSEIAARFQDHFKKPAPPESISSRMTRYKNSPDRFYWGLTGERPISERDSAEINHILQEYGGRGKKSGIPRRILAPLKTEEMRFVTILRTSGHMSWNQISKCYVDHFALLSVNANDGLSAKDLAYRWLRKRETDGGLYQSLSGGGEVPPVFEAEYKSIMEKYCTDGRKGEKSSLTARQLRYISILHYCIQDMGWAELVSCLDQEFEQEFGFKKRSVHALKKYWYRHRGGFHHLLKTHNQVSSDYKEEVDELITRYSKDQKRTRFPLAAS
ncbi:MAG: hypothetical protein M1812_006896 [Candelaria pacifica]|nr:MAG: hypothetical protein M1812_006896 [Candelaria pacifica]